MFYGATNDACGLVMTCEGGKKGVINNKGGRENSSSHLPDTEALIFTATKHTNVSLNVEDLANQTAAMNHQVFFLQDSTSTEKKLPKRDRMTKKEQL